MQKRILSFCFVIIIMIIIYQYAKDYENKFGYKESREEFKCK